MAIEVRDLSHNYNPQTAFEKKALSHVSFTLEKGEFVGLIGHTGSGKSTLIQHLNALENPHSGTIYYNGEDIFEKDAKMLRKTVRQKVGLVFQYPEHQLFETTIYKDVAFGPSNMGLNEKEIDERVKWALSVVGMGEEYYAKSPFDLSGGQKRRVAIAGVLAMKPEYLILDEPAAGLDPKGRDLLFDELAELRKETGMCIVLVSHSMEDVARYVNRLLVLNQGELVFDAPPAEVFAQRQVLERIGLDVPQICKLADILRDQGIDVPKEIIRIEDMKEFLVELYRRGGVS